MVTIKSEREIELMREAGRILAKVHEELGKELKAGMTTKEIDRICEEMIRSYGCVPSFLNYEGYPASVCVSINDEVVHGIPSKHRHLQEGDIVSLDTGVIWKGYQSDAARTHMIGQVSPEAKKLVEVTKESVDLALAEVKPWGHLGDIGEVISKHVYAHGYTVLHDIGGHGVGNDFHEEPYVCHIGKKGTGMLLVPGMVFTIEPMVNEGEEDFFQDEENGWTIYTEDGSLSAQWEYTVAITEDGVEVITH